MESATEPRPWDGQYDYTSQIKVISHLTFKDLYLCPIEIIKGLTDKGQFQYLKGLKGPQGALPVYNTVSFTKININILTENT